MPKTNETKSYFRSSFDMEIASHDLRSWFGKVVDGQPQVFDTPFAKGESTADLLRAWQRVLVSIKRPWPSLWEFEIDLANKVGPMSVQLPLAQRMDDIESYYQGITSPGEPLDKAAIQATVQEFGKLRGLRLRSQRKTVERMKVSTNSGSPFFSKRRTVIAETVPCTVSWAGDAVTQVLTKGTYTAAAILGWRGQEGGPSEEDVKQRIVWMFPFAVNVAELQLYQPFIEAAQHFDIVPAWVSNTSVDRRITQLFDTKGKNDLVVCTDFTKFDQHFGNPMQQAAKDILRQLMVPQAESTQWLANVFPIKYMIPLAYDWGRVRIGQHGMGSGSGGTNCDETLAHRALQYQAAISLGAKLNPASMCLGDDGILTFPGITEELVVKEYTRHGLEMNDTKQYSSTQDCVYLRRWHHKEYRPEGNMCAGVYSTCRALGRLRYLERWMDPSKGWDAKAVALRQLSIIENCKYHPLREKFVQFCMKRDKYRLGLTLPHFLDELGKVVEEKINFMPDFLGYTKSMQGDVSASGINDWWIVKYLRSLK